MGESRRQPAPQRDSKSETSAPPFLLLHSLPDPDYDVSDEEVAERVRQVKSGEVATISMDELRDGVLSDRGR
ncbi:MAG: hypothetical protein N2A42_04155 [Luteolibacter sp.]